MRALILDHYYPGFVEDVYRSNPGLAAAPFAEQQARLDEGRFGELQFQASAMRQLGHHAMHFPVNVPQLAIAWAAEHGAKLPRRFVPSARLRRGWVPWVSVRERTEWRAVLLRAVADTFEADLVHVACMDVLGDAEIEGLVAPGRRLTGQTAPPSPPANGLASFDLVFSSLPNYVEQYRAWGIPAAWMPLAFAPEAIELAGPRERDIQVSFIGSLSPHHLRRRALIDQVSRAVAIDVWSADDAPGTTQHGAAWGLEMYRALASSKATINIHGENAAGFANNLRLYEATGMGSLLLTEEAPNLSLLFEPATEVVTYRDADSLLAAIGWLRSEPARADRIAAAGQARTLRDHTWPVRMGQMLDALESEVTTRTGRTSASGR